MIDGGSLYVALSYAVAYGSLFGYGLRLWLHLKKTPMLSAKNDSHGRDL